MEFGTAPFEKYQKDLCTLIGLGTTRFDKPKYSFTDLSNLAWQLGGLLSWAQQRIRPNPHEFLESRWVYMLEEDVS